MTKKIISALLAFTMLFMTACGNSSQADTSKADTTTTSIKTTNSDKDDSSDVEKAATTTTTPQKAPTTSDISSKTDAKYSNTTKATTTTTSQTMTTTKQQTATTTQATYTFKPVQTTKATTTYTTKATSKATSATMATQPAAKKSALDLAYEAMVKCNPTQAHIDLIVKDLNNYVASKGFCAKTILYKDFYPFVDKNNKPTFDYNVGVAFGNCSFYEGWAQDFAASRYYEGKKTLEQAREYYKKQLKEHCDFQINRINDLYKEEKKNVSQADTIYYCVMIYKDYTSAMQRLDLQKKYTSFKAYVMTIGYCTWPSSWGPFKPV